MTPRRLVPLVLAFMLGACASPDSTEEDASGSGGTSTTGAGGSGGGTGRGGETGASGGTTGSGGSVGAGGTTGSGGTTGTAGTTGAAGTTGTGGTTGAGGTASGGMTGSGGAAGRGAGGTTGTGGRGGTTGKAGAGGATATGGATGTGGAAGSAATGGSGGATCNVSPVSPNASQQAKNLLCYLYSVYGNHVLSGQQETSWSNPAGDISWYASNGMQPPAILGGDFLYSDGGGPTSETTTTARAIAYWNAGGISMIRFHMGMPPNADSYDNSMLSPSGSFFTNVITSGTAENTSFVSKLDYMAYQIGVMKTNNVPVLLALFHETQANGWFWWSKGTGPQFIALWQYAFKYLTSTKGLTNIVWLMPFSGSPSSAYYPGKAYVDISGSDTYGTNQPFTSLYSSTRGVVGTTVPAPLHETGLIPTPSQMFPTAAPWVLFNIWAGYESDGTHNTTSNIQSAYASTYLITRNEIPSLK
jgi:Glycosyl hydrolase family 26